MSQGDFLELVKYIRDNYGINLEQKQTLVEGRLWNVLRQKGVSSVKEYFELVLNDKTGEEAKTLITKLTTNYTYFMREEQHYKYLKDILLPHLSKRITDKDIRIWSAGCSSGEEPYTIAMLIDEFFGPEKPLWDTTILATDISPAVLAAAVEGSYPAERLQNLPNSWISKYFIKENEETYRVTDRLKKEVIFRSFNLMERNYPFKRKFHIIFCRNVMIYFDKPTRDKLVERFYEILEPGGHLFIGLSETIDRNISRFQFVRPSIYRK